MHGLAAALQTVPYMPPELLEHGKLSFSVDVYSFGIIMHECFTGQVSTQTSPAARHCYACPGILCNDHQYSGISYATASRSWPGP
jgi:serine/threonine protein kinase